MAFRLPLFIRVSASLVGLCALSGYVVGNWMNVFHRPREAGPLILTTWGTAGFIAATEAGWKTLMETKGDTLAAVVDGCSLCQELRCDGTVGYGGSPDENGETTLDALLMHGPTGDVGAVASLKRVKEAIRVAAAVAKYTKHTLIVGEAATKFALEMGFKETDLHTNDSVKMWNSWIQARCQPNFRKNVIPNPSENCGPYRPYPVDNRASQTHTNFPPTHDTIGMIALQGSSITVGTSTNGARYKVPGRVGDAPIPGAGAYVDNEVGAACATGDGDILMRMLPSYQTVENMRQGMPPELAARNAIARLTKRYSHFQGAVVAVDSNGDVGAACHGFQNFSFCLRTPQPDRVKVVDVPCTRYD